MAITDELREYASGLFNTRGTVLAIADRIDAAHESKVAETRNDALYHANEKDMAELGWIHLPKDADGEYIHIGDRMENGERVERIVLTDGSWEPSVYLAKTPHVLREYFCDEVSHYHEPTVEDVLTEFARDFDAWRNYSGPANESPSNPVAEYAAKLRLAGEGE